MDCRFAAEGFLPRRTMMRALVRNTHYRLHGASDGTATVGSARPGDACTFRMAAVDRRAGPFTDIEFRSGDLIVFGGVNRRIFHGVPKIAPGTAPPGVGLPPGRLSITVRETGL